MSGGRRLRQMTIGQCMPRLEWLEARSLLSTYPAGITAVSPADGQVLSQSPQQLAVSFDPSDVEAFAQFLSELYETTVPPDQVLSTVLSTADLQLVSVNRDGSTTPVFDFSQYALQEQLDSTGVVLTVPMQVQNDFTGQAVNVTLAPGTYQLQLEGNTGLSIAISEAYSNGPALWDDTVPLVLSTFTVLGAGTAFADASDLSIGPTPQSYTFSLDPNDYASAVDLYKITLAPGQTWQLGLSVATESIDSPLLSTLALFDSKGNLLATSNAGAGFPTDPNDPYLFAGLHPTAQSDTYYIGVSGYGNMPYGPSGYDPVHGLAGTAGLSQPGGPFSFELTVAAQPHTQAAAVIDFSLNRADPHDPSPTSLTLTFSGPINVSSLFVPDQQETSLEVIDSAGKSWPVTAESYQVSDARLTLLFDEPLPAGQYSLIVTTTGGLTDLAGDPVVGPGATAGVLATWTVSSITGSNIPDDLGPLWPGSAGVVWPSSQRAFQGTVAIAPGQSVTYRWAAVVPGYYKLQTQVPGGALEIENIVDGQTTILDLRSSGNLNNYLMYLSTGVYEFRLINVGPQPVIVNWLLKIEGLDWEKIVGNGVSQASALSLMTFAPTLAAADASSDTGLLSIGVSPSADPLGGAIAPLPATLFVTMNSSLAGQPTGTGQPAPAVGALLDVGLAQAGGPSGQSVSDGFGSPLETWSGADDDIANLVKPLQDAANPSERPRPADVETVETRLDPEAPSIQADVRALAQAQWVERLGVLAQGWLGSQRPVAGAPSNADAPLALRLVTRNRAAEHERDLTGPTRSVGAIGTSLGKLAAIAGVITVSAATYRLRTPVTHWWRQRRHLAAPERNPTNISWPGPHPIAKRARAAIRSRGKSTEIHARIPARNTRDDAR